MFRSRFLLTAAVAVVAALTAPALSQAGYSVTISDGTTSQTFTGDPDEFGIYDITKTFTYSGGALKVTLHGTTNSPGSPEGLAQVTSQTTSVEGTGTLTAKTITVTNSTTDFSLSPLNGTLTTWLQATTLLGTATGNSMIDGSPNIASAVSSSGTGSNDSSSTQVSYGDPFSLGNTVTLNLAAHTVSSGSQILAQVQLDSSINAAPAPAGLVMLASALPFAGLLRLRRRQPKTDVVTAA